MTRAVSVVPHTHWDREWYAPFQTYRMRLVGLLDELLPRLEADPAYAHFQLDGQMAVVDDYLAVRPEAEARLRRLAASGRLSMGPWYVLMDEFLVSGETMVRNLRLGLERAAAFGGAMEVGYLPDMFGHIAQMPQLLDQFGFGHAVVWRGVPAAVDRSGFWWEAPDGSVVRAEWMPQGYSNGAVTPDDPDHLLARIAEFEADHAELLDGPILWMNGTDHLMPQPWLSRVVSEANARQDDYDLRVVPLAEHLERAPTDGLPLWRGELRSSARSMVLMGVASNRVDVKQAAARAEREIERLAEPLSALFLPPSAWPEALLAEAWMLVVRNSAHDSVCACSVDEVCDAVLHRYAEARQIGEGLTRRALRAVSRAAGGRDPVVVNPAARDRTGLVELEVPGEGGLEGTQLLHQRQGEVVLHEGLRAADTLPLLLRELEMRPEVASVDVEPGPAGVDVVLQTDWSRAGLLLLGPVRAAVTALAEEDADGPVRVVLRREPVRTVLARPAPVPGFGWRAWRPAPLDVEPVVAGGARLSNGLVTLEVDRSDGTFSLEGHAGLDRLVDDGDEGDTYNHSPPTGDVVVDGPEAVDVRVEEQGPLRGRLVVDRRFRWPARVEDHRRVGERVVDVRTVLELRAGERLVRVTTELDNTCRDHRLRAWFPLPEPATTSRAECAYAVVERGLEAEGGPLEHGLPTYPSRRFVAAGGLTVVHEGLLEYELVDVADGRAGALALTLLRCTGMLSQAPMAYRPMPAGPLIPVEGAQAQGRHVLRYGVAVGEGDPYALADDAFLPLLSARAGDGPGRAETGQALRVTGAEVAAVLRNAGQIELRVFNPSDGTVTVAVEGRSGWLVDLRGRPVTPFDGTFPLGPWRIATALLADGGDG
jgi:mannosylglycerate hydrolase